MKESSMIIVSTNTWTFCFACSQPTMKAVGWFGWLDLGHHGSMYAHAIP
jgi:hypothetical protein